MRSDRFRAAAEEKNFSAVDELFAEQASFRSPVVEVFEDFRYTDQVESGDTAVLIFEARVGDRELNGVDILRFDADDRIVELMVMVRPMSGVQALAEAMQTKLAGAGSG